MTQLAGRDFVYVGPRKVAVWPDEIRLCRFEPVEDRIILIFNPDIHQIQGSLIEKILEKEAVERVRSPQVSRGEGGQKIHDLDQLASPVFELINERAKEMFKRVTGAKSAVVDDCWANAFRDGEYGLPHAHKRSTASIVYALDNGDEEEAQREPMNGALIFSDPRLKSCCPGKPYYVSNAFRPTGVDPAVMVIFPSHLTHQVTPYHGKRPRISIAWNLNAAAVPGELRHDGKIE